MIFNAMLCLISLHHTTEGFLSSLQAALAVQKNMVFIVCGDKKKCLTIMTKAFCCYKKKIIIK